MLRDILNAVSSAVSGKRAAIVGGTIRDCLLQADSWSTDIDFIFEQDVYAIVDSIEAKLQPLFKETEIKKFPTFGTAKLLLKNSDQKTIELDFARARSEKYIHPGALPEVSFTTIEEDLKRRDFTINALAVPLETFLEKFTFLQNSHSTQGIKFSQEDIIDTTGGFQDCKNKILKTIHQNSFQDDPTRLFRSVRYINRFNLKLDPATKEQYKIAVDGGFIESYLSTFRIWTEIKKILHEPSFMKCLNYIKHSGLYASFYRKAIDQIADEISILSNCSHKNREIRFLKLILEDFTTHQKEDLFRKLSISNSLRSEINKEIVSLSTINEVEIYLKNILKDEFFDVPIELSVCPDYKFGDVSTNCVLLASQKRSVSPEHLSSSVMNLIGGDIRFTLERGFLNFNSRNLNNWLFTPEIFSIKDSQYRVMALSSGKRNFLSDLRLKSLVICHIWHLVQHNLTPILYTKNSQTLITKENFFERSVNYILNQDFSILDNADFINENSKDGFLSLYVSPEGISTESFIRFAKLPSRDERRFNFDVLPKVISESKGVTFPSDWLEKVTQDETMFLNMIHYMSMPLHGSEVDPNSCLLNENANLYWFISKMNQKLKSWLNRSNEVSNALTQFSASHSEIDILRRVKLFPAHYSGVLMGHSSFSAFLRQLYNLLSSSETLINTPSLRAKINNGDLSYAQMRILSGLDASISLILPL